MNNPPTLWQLEQYKGAFDVVCVGDGGMEFVVDIVREVIEGKGEGGELINEMK